MSLGKKWTMSENRDITRKFIIFCDRLSHLTIACQKKMRYALTVIMKQHVFRFSS